jgi:hypothetical protein
VEEEESRPAGHNQSRLAAIEKKENRAKVKDF